VRGVSREVQKLFLKYGWPGNVRELANVLESAAMLCKKDFIDVANLPKYLRDYVPAQGPVAFGGRGQLSTLSDLEKDYITYLLKVTKGNLRQTARILSISRTTLYNKLASTGSGAERRAGGQEDEPAFFFDDFSLYIIRSARVRSSWKGARLIQARSGRIPRLKESGKAVRVPALRALILS